MTRPWYSWFPFNVPTGCAHLHIKAERSSYKVAKSSCELFQGFETAIWLWRRKNALKVCLKRFPRDVREELDKIVQRSSWQALTKEFSVDLFTGLEAEALDSIPNLVDKSYEECQEDVKARLKILKNMKAGTNQSHKGRNSVGFHSYFYRYS